MKVECSQQYVSITPSGTPWASMFVVMVIVMMIKMNRVAAMMVIMTKMRCCPSPHPLDGAVMFMARTMNGTAVDIGDGEYDFHRNHDNFTSTMQSIGSPQYIPIDTE